MNKHRETPTRRVNPSGNVVWLARYTNRHGKRVLAKPAWNGGKATFRLRRDAQRAIDEAHEREYNKPSHAATVGGYFESWTDLHPRSTRTNDTNRHRISRVLDIELEGVPLRDWEFGDLRRRHAAAILDTLLRDQRRSARGARHILNALSALTEDAINDELADVNPWRVKVRANDPRITKAPKPPQVFTFEEMHHFASKAGRYEALVRTFCDLGVRLGEGLPLYRSDLESAPGGDVVVIRRTAHEGTIQDGTKTDHGEAGAGRVIPAPPGWLKLARAQPARIDTPLLFTTPTGRLWRERNFYRDVWQPARDAIKDPRLRTIRPHDMRHSWITHLRASGVDDADLAAMSGHTIETMLATYTHALGRSFADVRRIIG